MKMWEAMLEGAKKGPQLFNMNSDANGGSCAAGAIQLLQPILCGVWDMKASCPKGPCESYSSAAFTFNHPPETVGRVVVHLNNQHRWSRQRIAIEFLLPIEEKYLKKEKEVEMAASNLLEEIKEATCRI